MKICNIIIIALRPPLLEKDGRALFPDFLLILKYVRLNYNTTSNLFQLLKLTRMPLRGLLGFLLFRSRALPCLNLFKNYGLLVFSNFSRGFTLKKIFKFVSKELQSLAYSGLHCFYRNRKFIGNLLVFKSFISVHFIGFPEPGRHSDHC